MEKYIKKLLKYTGVFVLLITIYILSLTLVSMIPTENIKENVKESSEILVSQTNRYMIRIRNSNIMFDNYTDALMVNNAYSIDTSTPFYSAMMARKNYIPGTTEVVYKYAEEAKILTENNELLDQVGDLVDTLNNETKTSFEYARYWHGYLILLRIELLFLNIGEIRIIMSVIFIMLLAILTYLLSKKSSVIYAIAVALRNTSSRLSIYRNNTAKYTSIFSFYDSKYFYCFSRKQEKKHIHDIVYFGISYSFC